MRPAAGVQPWSSTFVQVQRDTVRDLDHRVPYGPRINTHDENLTSMTVRPDASGFAKRTKLMRAAPAQEPDRRQPAPYGCHTLRRRATVPEVFSYTCSNGLALVTPPDINLVPPQPLSVCGASWLALLYSMDLKRNEKDDQACLE